MGSSPLARGALELADELETDGGIIPACAGSTAAADRLPDIYGDHPRLRGEHPCDEREGASWMGSSPLARGALARVRPHAREVGIIPACAGSTQTKRCRMVPRGDHPRLRGEHRALSRRARRYTGSSPLARGAPCTPPHSSLASGIIPACAGSTTGPTLRANEARGSSPLARGARWSDPPHWLRHGIIPACAGSTWARPWMIVPRWDHPRLRGEHDVIAESLKCAVGSSPLARGALIDHSANDETDGIIPACAGSTPRGCGGRTPRRDHPRLRGEHRTMSRAIVCSQGSSPLARGAPTSEDGDGGDVGIIPACAGSTTTIHFVRDASRDHPRLRGEHTHPPPLPRRMPGSSPLARGALSRKDSRCDCLGIIPACAGSTGPRHSSHRWRGDHPRLRGEHSIDGYISPAMKGSSPLARGAHGPLHPPSLARRIIPACAGSTTPRTTETPSPRDHPRLRGEHKRNRLSDASEKGSSPLARGALWCGLGRSHRVGIIPACAGSTAAPRSACRSGRDHPRLRGEHHGSLTCSTCVRGSSPLARGALCRWTKLYYV